MSVVEQIKAFQTGSLKSNSSLEKTIQDISQISSKSNEISSFLNEASIASGNSPFNLSKFAREFILKQNNSNEGQTNKITDSKPITRKSNQIISKVVKNITDNFLRSEKLTLLLEKQINQILKQSKVNYVSIQDGQIQAQPIQSKELDQVISNLQKTITTYINAVDRYGKRIYNDKPIKTTNDLKNNLSLNQIINFIETIISIALLIINLKIKIRKAQDVAAAASALAAVPPQPATAARFTQMALENTASEQKQLDDLAATQELILNVKRKISFYGKKYENSKNKLLTLQNTLNNIQKQYLDKTLNQINNQITGSF